MFRSINGGRLPERATKYSAGFDVFTNEDVVIGAGETKIVNLGIAIDGAHIEISKGRERLYFALHIRSSLRAKGLTSLGTGIIDMDYRDEIKMVIHNPVVAVDIVPVVSGDIYLGDEARVEGFGNEAYGEFQIKKGDKIGQLILCRHEGYLLPSEYTKDEERTGGFGSTGK